MTRASDTGESLAATARRADDQAWNSVLPMMQAGAKLVRNSKTRRSYVDGHGGLSDGRVRRLEEAGTIRLIGAYTYVLADQSL